MKNTLRFAFIMVVLWACQGNKSDETASGAEWPQLDEFHFLMAESFHPYADSGNLAPAREHAEEMAALAEAWSKAALPEKVDGDEMRALLTRLSAETAEFTAIVATRDDATIGESLSAVHDLFHEIHERWYATDHEHADH